jgi:GntR family transcriptional regulator
MDIRISKESTVPLHEQISGQLVHLIATGKLLPGETLPGIKTIARQLKVHHNTVSEAMRCVTW